MKDRIFKIKDIDCETIVEVSTRKEVLAWLDDYIDNLECGLSDGGDQAFSILYKDGTCDFINEEYDGHKIKRINIASIVYDNPGTSMVYGCFEINEYGVVTPSFVEAINEENIIELK